MDAHFRPAFSRAVRDAPVRSLRFERLAHDDFTSDHLVNYVHAGRDEPTFPIDEIDRSYALMCRSILDFLQGYLLSNDEARARLASAPDALGVPRGWVSVVRD